MRIMSVLRLCTLLPVLWLWPGSAVASPVGSIPEDGHSAVILAYHRVGEDSLPDTSIRTEQFAAHVEEMVESGYTVMPLPALIAALKESKDLPPRTIAITFEGAFKSALEHGIPLLMAKKIPFTIFYSSDYADGNSNTYMNWNDLKGLASQEGVTFGLLPARYARLDGGEENIKRSINKARSKHREVFGKEATLFSYPFGEYSLGYKKIVAESGFDAAFGLQSGAAFPSSDFYALPRFTMTERYGDLDRFRTAAQTLPFPVIDVEPQDTVIGSANPSIGFSVPDYLQGDLKSLSCFASGQADPDIEILGERIELRLREAATGRVRINCTLPGPVNPQDDSASWRWFGMLLAGNGDVAPDEDSEISSNPQPPIGLP